MSADLRRSRAAGTALECCCAKDAVGSAEQIHVAVEMIPETIYWLLDVLVHPIFTYAMHCAGQYRTGGI